MISVFSSLNKTWYNWSKLMWSLIFSLKHCLNWSMQINFYWHLFSLLTTACAFQRVENDIHKSNAMSFLYRAKWSSTKCVELFVHMPSEIKTTSNNLLSVWKRSACRVCLVIKLRKKFVHVQSGFYWPVDSGQ